MNTSPDGLLIASIIVCSIYCFLIAVADYALRALNINKLKKDMEQGSQSAKRIYDLSQEGEPSSLQMARFFIELFVIAFLADRLIFSKSLLFEGLVSRVGGFLGSLLFIVRLGILSVCYVLFFYFLPQRLAKERANRLINALYPLAGFSAKIFSPLAFIARKLLKGFSRLLKLGNSEETVSVTEDEIRVMLDEGGEKGAIEEAERDMIENVFEFNDLSAEDCMTHRRDMQAIWIDDSEESLLKAIKETGKSRFPVYGDSLDDILGILTARDYLLNRLSDKPKSLKALLRTPHFVPETVRSDHLFRQMQQNKFHMAIVVDEYGGTSGVITMEDLLEQIVGNIYDEYDSTTTQNIIKKKEGLWLVKGQTEVEAFNEEVGSHLPIDEEFETMAGYAISALGSIPKDGSEESFEKDGFRFKLTLVKDRRIELMLVERTQKSDAGVLEDTSGSGEEDAR